MKWFSAIPLGVATAAVFLGGLTSCKKHGEALKSDLDEAGYKLTAEDWFRASRENDAAALKRFIAGGFSADLRNPDGDSALHIAASAGAEASADYLLSRGLPVDFPGAADRTPLMSAVIADQTRMVRWLLRQGADPRAKDKDGFMPLMLAVREGSGGAVAELAAYNREDLDSALLLAALMGRADVIDSLTNYGASIYARMEDGRTPLMVAAENGHKEAVELLLDLGSSRYATNPDGHTAGDLAKASGHDDIAALILREPLPDELTLESPERLAREMDAFVDSAPEHPHSSPGSSPAPAASTPPPQTSPGIALGRRMAGASPPRETSIPIQGAILSTPVIAEPQALPSRRPSPDASSPAGSTAAPFAMPPLVMRHYREREVPVSVRSVQGDTATVTIAGTNPRQMKIRTGETIPGTRLSIVRVQRRMEDSKVNAGKAVEISVVDVRDPATGTTREWIAGVTSNAHDPVALVEDAATGRRYLATPGQRFKAADGSEFIVADVRPNQIVIEDAASGAVQTLPLRGPRG